MAAPRQQLMASLVAANGRVRVYEKALEILRNRGHEESVAKAMNEAVDWVTLGRGRAVVRPAEPLPEEKPEPRYYPEASLYTSDDEGTVRVPECPDCGALVTDTSIHNAWHERTKS